ncbi:MAG TPA: DNA repair exonuclease [Anaerolineae bacterium]|nr:DNA repair exonuclease [Anaerolineae bacterium]
MVRILHTSDVQLDAPFHFLGDKGQRHRQQLRKTFQCIVDMAAEAGFDLLLITGDLFNDNRPHQDTIDFVVSQLGRLDIPVCILPGNHDCYDSTSVYRKARFPDNVVIFTEQPTIREFAELDVTVYGNAILSRQSRLSPLRGLTRTGTMRWHIALAHGNLVRPDIADPSRPIRPEEISASGMDYVAMGDWHAFADYSQGRVKAFYSGAPEPTAPDQKGAGYVACIEIDENGMQVRPERVGTISTDGISVDVAGKSVPQIVEEIRARADPNLMLKVTLSGLVGLGVVLDTERMEQELVPYFYHVECSDQFHPQLATISPDDFPEELVVGKFVRLMQARIEDATDDIHRRRAEQALQVGVALLQGRRVL